MKHRFRLPNFVEIAALRGELSEEHNGIIHRSKKFHFDLSLEAINAALDYAGQMRDFEIYALPFPECYFEMHLTAEPDDDDLARTVGFLLWEDAEKIKCRSYNFFPDTKTYALPYESFTIPLSESETQIIIEDDAMRGVPSSMAAMEFILDRREWVSDHAVISRCFVDMMIGSLSLGGVVHRLERTHHDLNKGASKRALSSYSTIYVPADVSPRATTSLLRRAAGDRSAVRLHWRRGHIRRLANGKLTQVKPALIGDRRFDAISSEYAVVSRAA